MAGITLSRLTMNYAKKYFYTLETDRLGLWYLREEGKKLDEPNHHLPGGNFQTTAQVGRI